VFWGLGCLLLAKGNWRLSSVGGQPTWCCARVAPC
jgi:hypothetical protein